MRLELVYETHSTSVDNDRGNTTGWLPGELSEILPRAGPGPRASADGTTAPPWSTRPISAARSRRLRSRSPARASRFVTRLRECDYGDLNGAPVETVTAVRCRHIDEPFPAGGSYRQVVERTRSFLAEVVARHHGARILVIAHSANRWALDHLVNGVPLEEFVDAPFARQEGWLYVVSANASSSASDIA